MNKPDLKPEPLGLRILKVFPDAITAAVFLWVWIDPSGWRTHLVAQGLLIMLTEFILIHSAGFLGPVVFSREEAPRKRIRIAMQICLFYSLFVGVWAWQFNSWWTLAFFLWLMGAKLMDILVDRQVPEHIRLRQHGMIAASAVFYLACVFATLFLPLPELGLMHHGHFYGVPGSGAWVSHPHIVISAAFLYFTLLSLTKLLAWDLAFAPKKARQ